MADRSRWDYGDRDRYRGSRYDLDDRDYERDYERGGRDFNAGGSWGGGTLRNDYDRGPEEIAGFRGTGYLGGDYGQARLDRNDYERDYRADTYSQTRGSETPSYRGRGPKNYHRSDERIREDVCERLERDHRVDASEIEVNVSGGVVTLSGAVNDRDMKRRAEDLAESCGGVTDVQNQIRIARKD